MLRSQIVLFYLPAGDSFSLRKLRLGGGFDCQSELQSVSMVTLLYFRGYWYLLLPYDSLPPLSLLVRFAAFARREVPIPLVLLFALDGGGLVARRFNLSAMFSYFIWQRSIRFIEYEQSDNLQFEWMSRYDDEISYATNKKHTIKFKIVFIGDQSVGKSSIINRFIKNQFDPTHNPTVGIDFVSKNVTIKQKSVRLQLWDTAGQQRFRSLIPGYLRDSHSVFLVYDVTNADSFQNLNMWLDYIKENRGEDVNVVIVGNKIDQTEDRAITYNDAKEKLKYVGASYFEVSAKTGENLEKLFIDTCVELLKGNELETTTSNIELPKKKPAETVTGEKERPITKANSKPAEQKKAQGEMRGSKLMKKGEKSGKFVKEKNCC